MGQRNSKPNGVFISQEDLENESKMLEEMRDKLVAQQIANMNAIESAEIVRNLGKKAAKHIGNIKNDLSRPNTETQVPIQGK